MFVVYEDKEIVGYRLVLCDELWLGNSPQYCGWYSCLWVDPAMRGKGIALALARESASAWAGNIIIADPAPANKSLTIKTGLYSGPRGLNGARAYLRFNTAFVLPAKNAKYQPYKHLLSLADGLLNIPQGLRLWLHNIKSTLTLEKIARADDEVGRFIAPYLEGQLFRRGVEELNWITDYPWIKTGQPDHDSKRYYFSSVADRFEFQHWKLRDATGRMVAYVLTAIRNKNLKVPYAYFDAKDTENVAKFIVSLMLAEKLDMLTTYHPLLAPYFLKNKSPFVWVKPMCKNYFVGKEMGEVLQAGTNPNFADGDGDQAFT